MTSSSTPERAAGVLQGHGADVIPLAGPVLLGGGLDVGQLVLGESDGDYLGARVGAGRSTGAGHGHSLETTVSPTNPSTSSLASSDIGVYDKSMTSTHAPIKHPCDYKVFQDTDGSFYSECPSCGWQSANYYFRGSAADFGAEHRHASAYALLVAERLRGTNLIEAIEVRS